MTVVVNDREDVALRPIDFSDYVGQAAVKEVLDVAIEAAQERGDQLEHILIWGPPGTGKTTIAHIIANTLKANLKIFIGGNLKSTNDMMGIMRRVGSGDIIFIDEIHRMWIPAQEMLYPPMEDGILNQKIAGTMTTINLPPFTLIGATTDVEKLAQPFIDRFGIKLKLEDYSLKELETICQNTAVKLGVEIDDEAKAIVAKKAKGTPRVVNSMMRRLRDFAQYHDVKVMDAEFVNAILNKEGMQWTVE